MKLVKASEVGSWADCGHTTYENTTLVEWQAANDEHRLCLRCARRVAAFVEQLAKRMP